MHPIRVHVEGNNLNLIISGAKNTCAGLSVTENTSCNILVCQVCGSVQVETRLRYPFILVKSWGLEAPPNS